MYIRFILILFILIYSRCYCYSQDFKVTFPENTTLQSPWIVNFYADTINGKVIFNGWPFDGNIIVNTHNHSNNYYSCGNTFPYAGFNRFYLTYLYPSISSHCYSSGPIPDTIEVEIRNAIGEVQELIYFVITAQNPPGMPMQPILTIYPNPTLNSITIASNETIVSAELTDAIGRKLTAISPVNPLQFLSLANYAAGCYFLKLQNVNGTYTVHKVVKIKE